MTPRNAERLYSLPSRKPLREVHGGGFSDVRRQALSEGLGVVCVDAGVIGRAGDGDVGEAIVDEATRGFGVDMGENAACGKALRTVRGNGVAVIELPKLRRVKCDSAGSFAIHSQGYFAVCEADNGSEVAVGNTELLAGCGELNTVSRGELPLNLPEYIDTLQSARVVADG